jgi:transposase
MMLREHVAKLSQKQVVALLAINEKFLDLQKQYEEKAQKIVQQAQRIAELEQQNEWFKRQLFGRKSERRILGETDSRQYCLGEILEGEETPPPPTETIKSYQRRQRRKEPMEGGVLEAGLRFDDSVPIEEIEIPNPALEGIDSSLYEIVSEKVTHRLAQKPGSYVILKYIRKVAKLKENGKLLCAPAPSSVLEKSYADVSFLAGLLIDKFRYHLPLYRQHQRLADTGILLSRATLTTMVHRTVDLLEPIYYALLSSILQSRVITMDETPIKATRIKATHRMKTGYFWPVYGDREEIAFLFALSRASPVVKEVLGSFGGVLLSDGYKVYDTYAKSVESIVHAQCWAHTRRKFDEALRVEPALCKTALDEIGDLYEVEAHIREQGLKKEAKARYRAEHSTPIVDRFFTWLQGTFQKHILLPTSPFTVAANYALEREAALRVFLKDPDVPIDTNHIERRNRPIAIGRKNWLFCWTEIGAHYVGIANSLIASCLLQDIDPYTYLVDVLQRIDTHPALEVHRLTPRLWKEEFAATPLRSDIDPRKNQ